MFDHTPKGMSEIPDRAGEYMLLDDCGNDIHGHVTGCGWKPTDNLRKAIKLAHYDRSKKFSYIKTRKR